MTTNLYMLWEYDLKADREQEIQRALDYYMQKYGAPPTILECSTEIKPVCTDIPVRYKNMPRNILLIGELDEQEAEERGSRKVGERPF